MSLNQPLNSPTSPPAAAGPTPGSKRPEDSAFKQQRLPAWQPIMSPPYVVGCFFILALIFIPIGGAVIAASDAVIEYTIRYDDVPCPFSERTEFPHGWACEPTNKSFTIEKTMKAPIFLYYRLENFYQNHRRYARSKSDTQLSGYDPNSENLDDCRPYSHLEYTAPTGDTAPQNPQFKDGAMRTPLGDIIYNPCGLVAWSMFNDSFLLYNMSTTGRPQLICNGMAFDDLGNPEPFTSNPLCEKKGIAWPSDPGVRFVDAKVDDRTLTGKGWPEMPKNDTSREPLRSVYEGWYVGEEGHKIPKATDEDLMVWMRLSSLSTFRKLYRRITVDLPPGEYQMSVLQRYDVRAFNGKKFAVLTTSSWIGGKNYFLGGLYVAVGGLCLILAAGFLAKHLQSPRRVSSL